jgi:hypothetical protein
MLAELEVGPTVLQALHQLGHAEAFLIEAAPRRGGDWGA